MKVSFSISSTDYRCKLGFTLYHGSKQIYHTEHVDKQTPISFEIDADAGETQLQFVMKNKTHADKNACLEITNFMFDYIALEHTFLEHCVYHHDFNGSRELIEDSFWGNMGCNGTVVFSYTTPVHLWLVNNM